MLTQLSLRKIFFNRRAILASVLLTLILGITLTAFTRQMRRSKADSRTPSLPTSQGQQPRQGRVEYVGGHLVWPSLRESFRAMASRLEKPGTERIVITGTLSRLKSGNPNPVPVRVIFEQPNRLRLEEESSVTVFDGASLTKSGSQPTEDNADEMETLLLDFPERLFIGLVVGNPLRQLGSRFRTDDGSNRNYSGPYFDVYEMGERLRMTSGPPDSANGEFTNKRYYINSDTNLLERVVYERRNKKVEVRLTDWRLVEKQRIPFSIIRLEDGTPALQLTMSTATLARRANDGLFPATN